MCDSDFSGEEDNLVVSGKGYELKPLSFTGYEICGDKKQLELGIPSTNLDLTKLSVVRDDFNPINFNILYDGHK